MPGPCLRSPRCWSKPDRTGSPGPPRHIRLARSSSASRVNSSTTSSPANKLFPRDSSAGRLSAWAPRAARAVLLHVERRNPLVLVQALVDLAQIVSSDCSGISQVGQFRYFRKTVSCQTSVVARWPPQPRSPCSHVGVHGLFIRGRRHRAVNRCLSHQS